jgi:hypothetical protein
MGSGGALNASNSFQEDAPRMSFLRLNRIAVARFMNLFQQMADGGGRYCYRQPASESKEGQKGSRAASN